ncbi:hypothetical protein [Streptomyces sp. NPDC041003]|uniref:hypothetical protein n=1 Tax=Streptomyces sp. NPDC041003 TaxID=3155730 RepID=UPI00340A2F6C
MSDISAGRTAGPLSAVDVPLSPSYDAMPLVLHGLLPQTGSERGRDDDDGGWDEKEDEGDPGRWASAVYFDTFEPPESGEPGDLGRLTFERLEAIKVTGGEYLPYERPDGGGWAYVMDDSPWLAERHDYVMRHYGRSLLEAHRHYVFVFHDEFIEAIGRGLRLDRVDRDALVARGFRTY